MNKRRMAAEVILQVDTYEEYQNVISLTNKFTSETLEQMDHNLTTGSSVHKVRIVDQKIKWLTVEDENGEEMDIKEFEKEYYREEENRKVKNKKDTKS